MVKLIPSRGRLNVLPGGSEVPPEDLRGRSMAAWRWLALLLVGVSVVAVVLFFWFNRQPSTVDMTMFEGEEELPQYYVNIEEIFVSLNVAEGAAPLATLSLSLLVRSPEARAAVQGLSPQLVHQTQVMMREMTPQELRGSAGLYRLRRELLYRFNRIAAPERIEDVLFQRFELQ